MKKEITDKRMLAALNTFFRFAGCQDCCVKQLKDIAKLADILGHSNINITRAYIIGHNEIAFSTVKKERLFCT